MNKPLLRAAGRCALLAAVAAMASLAPGVAGANHDTTAAAGQSYIDYEAQEWGTIPAARPGLPGSQRGAAGPIRTERGNTRTDPSIRDANALTMHGLWETRSGNQVVYPQ